MLFSKPLYTDLKPILPWLLTEKKTVTGRSFACYRGLTESLPYHRLFNSPISEAAIVGTACGYASKAGVLVN